MHTVALLYNTDNVKRVMFPGFTSYKHSGVEIIQLFACSADRIYSLALCVATIVVE